MSATILITQNVKTIYEPQAQYCQSTATFETGTSSMSRGGLHMSNPLIWGSSNILMLKQSITKTIVLFLTQGAMTLITPARQAMRRFSQV